MYSFTNCLGALIFGHKKWLRVTVYRYRPTQYPGCEVKRGGVSLSIRVFRWYRVFDLDIPAPFKEEPVLLERY